jgi:phosphate:Na+ symporter
MTGLLELFGGLGLFLIGMPFLTEGLKAIAGSVLRQSISRFTKGPVSGALTGAVATALIQSSGAITVMAVGFVGAGVMTFQQALGIIFGANVGTTITGWMVAVLGLQLDLSRIVLPLIFLGSLLRLFGKDRTFAWGSIAAGFGMTLLGISTLQSGMVGFGEYFTPDDFPPNTLWGRMQLLFLGLVITLITQSSSAGVAMVVAALHANRLSLVQGASLVIGMDIGTTATAMLAAVGGNVNARRTGVAHVVFNMISGVIAFLIAPGFVLLWERLTKDAPRQDPEIGLVLFHSLFNVLGVFLVLPFTDSFAKLIHRIVPSGDSDWNRRLEPGLLQEPSLALQNVLATLEDLSKITFKELGFLLSQKGSRDQFVDKIRRVQDATQQTKAFLDRLVTTASDTQVHHANIAAYHVLDHLSRLLVRAAKQDRFRSVPTDQELQRLSERLSHALLASSIDGITDTTKHALEAMWLELDQRVEPYRHAMIEKSVKEHVTTDETLSRLDGIRWLRRIAYHAWRISFHLGSATRSTSQGASNQILHPESEPLDE